MTLRRTSILTLLWLALAACVTVNIYFPAAAADKAADHIIDEVWGEDGLPMSPAPGAGELPDAMPESAPTDDGLPGDDEPVGEADFGAASRAAGAMVEVVLRWLVPAAHAAEPEFNISSPAIRRIEASMKNRHSAMEPFFRNGTIGLSNDGLVAVRDMNLVGLRERGRVKLLVDEENADRKKLYRELAKANGQPRWEGRIREVFARRWINRAPGGWYYQDGSRAWKQK